MELAKESKRIIQLDGLRGIAVLLVVAYHYIDLQYDKMDMQTVSRFEKILIHLTSVGWFGVDLFFVLSGFLIGSILLKNTGSPNFFKTFYLRRFFRIIPIYYVLLIIFGLLKISSLYQPDASVFEKDIPLIYYFVFLQNFAMGFYHTFGPIGLGATWSLAVEEQFYLIIPVLIYYIKSKYYKYIIIAGLIMAPLCRMLFSNYYVGYTWLPSRINAPMIGFLLALLMQNEKFKLFCKSHLGGIKIFTLIFLIFSGIVHVYFNAGAFNHSLIGVDFGLVVLIALFTESGPLFKILSSRILLFLGSISYFLYLFHQLVNDMLHLIILHQKTPMLDSAYAAWITVFALGSCLLVGWLSNLYFEGPLIRYGHKFKY
jgi:peptidoglycan/LPS O-acetylase OafA/YrhL